MTKRASLWVLLTTTVFAAAVLVLTPAGQAVAQSMNPLLVRVINAADAPVPVTGVTSITGTANVHVTNTPDVNIANQPTVNANILSGSFVAIDPANNTVQVAAHSPGTPFQATLGFAFLDTSPWPEDFAVPVDKRLVVEFVSGRCQRTDGNTAVPDVRLLTTTGGVAAHHQFPIASLVDSFDPVTVIKHPFAESTTIYADPGTIVRFSRSGGAAAPGSLICSLTMSGLLADASGS